MSVHGGNQVPRGVDPKALWWRFNYPGPIGREWMLSDARTSLIVGPYGSMKTSAGCMKCMLTTARQHPSKFDGVRKAYIVAIRQNYRRMHKTLLPSIKKFFGNDARWPSFEKNGPCTLEFDWHDTNPATGEKTNLSLQIDFQAFGEQEITEFVAGFEPTAFWVNEWNELPKNSLGSLMARCTDRTFAHLLSDEHNANPANYSRIFGDCNAPDLDEWATDYTTNRDYIEGRDPNVRVYIQPSAFSPQAEGMPKIQPGYAQAIADGFLQDGTPWKVKRFVENISGYSIEGAPIYPEFDQFRHIAKDPIIPEKNRKLIIGVDQGGQSSCIITQKRSTTQVTINGEVVPDPEEYIGGAESAERLVEFLAQHEHLAYFLRPGALDFVVDGAGNHRNATARNGEAQTFFKEFMKGWEMATGWSLSGSIRPWRTSINATRIISVRKLLLGRTRKTHDEMLQIDPSCVIINRGFAGGYRRVESKIRPGTYGKEPDKNYYSNPHDAFQAAAMEHVVNIEQGIMPAANPDDGIIMRQMGFDTTQRQFCEPMEVIH